MPKISIIVPAYNEEALPEETIKCLKAQTFKNFECIVIDDCSTDQTKVVATKSFGGDSRFRLISNKINSKLPATRNIGLLYASGDYILFIDGDDVISATCLEERYNVAINNDYKFVAGSWSRHTAISEDSKVVPPSKPISHSIVTFQSSLGDTPFVVHSPLVKREIVTALGGFDEAFSIGAEDYHFWMKILRHGFIFIPTNTFNAFYRQKSDSMVRAAPSEHLEASLSIFECNNTELDEDDFYSAAYLKMVKPAYKYALQERCFSRILQFIGMEIASSNDVKTNLELISQKLPDFYAGFPMHLSARDLLDSGILRSKPILKKGLFSKLGGYEKVCNNFISKITLMTSERIINKKTEKEYKLYSPAWQRNIDIIFIPHKDYHVKTIEVMYPKLCEYGLNCVIADCSALYRDEGVRSALQCADIPRVSMPVAVFGDYAPKAIVVFNDWDTTVTRPAILAAQQAGILDIAIVEGVQDYDDCDTGRIRNPYKTAHNIILPCEFDKKYFANSSCKTVVGGIPRIIELWKIRVEHPYNPASPIVINANFTYNVLTDKRDDWVRSAVDACKKLGFEYVISRHPAEKGDFSEYNVTDDSMYNAIWNGSLFISRFGSGIIESIAMGRPVVYYNPHNEQVDKFKYPDGAYYIANTQNELMQSILDTYATRENLEKNWDRFLTLHAGFNPENPDSAVQGVVNGLIEMLQSFSVPDEIQRKKFGKFFQKNFQQTDNILFRNITISPSPAKPAPSPAKPAPSPAKPARTAPLSFSQWRKIRKLFRNPYQFFADSQKSIKYLKYFFIFQKK